MSKIEIISNSSYLPDNKITNQELEKKWKLKENYIFKRTGILNRYKAEETIETLAWKAVQNLKLNQEQKNEIELIIVATTTTNLLMPGISNFIQKKLQLKTCICLDILAGCSGYINAFDIAKMYIENQGIGKALIIGVDKLSTYVDNNDINTGILLSDGAGVTLIGKSKNEKQYTSLIQTQGENNEILTCKTNEKIQMNGTQIYKYAVTKTVENIKQLLNKTEESIENIKYIIPHQSNKRIMKAIANRLQINEEKIYCNIETIGNTFCASIPIALEEVQKKQQLKKGDKIILLGYGGGLNTGSILLEI